MADNVEITILEPILQTVSLIVNEPVQQSVAITVKEAIDGQDGIDGINGTNGQDGITPILSPDENGLNVSIDDGETFDQLVSFQTIIDGSTITASKVGLGNVDNTSDSEKPISTAAQNALDFKIDSSTFGLLSGNWQSTFNTVSSLSSNWQTVTQKANISGGNTFSGTQNIIGSLSSTSTIIANSSIQSSNGNVSCASAGSLSILGRSRIYSASDGTLQFRNNTNTADASLAAASLTLGGTLNASGNIAGLGSSNTLPNQLASTPDSIMTRSLFDARLASQVGTIQRVVATTDQIATGSGVTYDTALSGVMLSAGSVYQVNVQVRLIGTTGSIQNAQLLGTFTTTASAACMLYERAGFSTENFAQQVHPTAFASFSMFNLTGASTQTARFKGTIKPTNGGMMYLYFTNGSASGTTTRVAGSYIEAIKIS